MKIKIPFTNKHIGIKINAFTLEDMLSDKIASDYGLKKSEVRKTVKDYMRYLKKTGAIQEWSQRKQNDAMAQFVSSIHVMVWHWLFECKCVEKETFDEKFMKYVFEQAKKNELMV